MSIATLKAVLYSWASARSGQTTIFAEQNGPRPALPYVTVRVARVEHGGLANRRLSTPGNPDTHYRPVRLGVEVQCYGPGALTTAENLHNSLDLEAVQDLFSTSNFARATVESVLSVSTVVDTGFEERGAFDIVFHGVQEITEDLGAIEHVNVNGVEVG